MANWYVRSNSTGLNDGSSWNNAYTTITGAIAGYTPGDTFWISQQHRETPNNSRSINFTGTASAITYLLCVDDSSEPPVLQSSGAIIGTSGNNALTINGAAYIDGINWVTSTGGGANGSATLSVANSAATDASLYFNNCSINILSTSSSASFTLGNSTTSAVIYNVIFNNTRLRFSQSSQVFNIRKGNVTWSNIFNFITGNFPGAANNLITTNIAFPSKITFNNVIANNVNGRYITSAATSTELNIYGCNLNNFILYNPASNLTTIDELNINIVNSFVSGFKKHYKEVSRGIVYYDSDVYRNNGANDDISNFSYRMISRGPTSKAYPLKSYPILYHNTSINSPQTYTVNFATNNLQLSSTGVWLEVEYLTSSSGISSSSSEAGFFTTGSLYTAGTGTWAGADIGTAQNHELSVTFTPQAAGLVKATVNLAADGITGWYCPAIRIS